MTDAGMPDGETGLREEVADLFMRWVEREGLLARITEDQVPDLAKAFMVGYLTALHRFSPMS